jgi:protein farnesyltransferase subunit beta
MDFLFSDAEGLSTATSDDQCECEAMCSRFLVDFRSQRPKTLKGMVEAGMVSEEMEIVLMREVHANFLTKGLQGLPGGFVSLDASKPWICYWILHALYLLKEEPTYMYSNLISTLSHMQAPGGGYGGGVGQIPHCAATYASVLALCTTRRPDALLSINREKMYQFFMSVRDESSGGFAMHDGGEVDTRGTYTAVAIARILNIMTPELVKGTAEYLLSCQGFEGGFGGEPGNEAHGGYNFCAVAALLILGEASRMNVRTQKHWLCMRQTRIEGGFQGRTNKLVDSCYSFWQGAAAAIVGVVEVGGSDITDMETLRGTWTGNGGGNSGGVEDEDGVIDLDLDTFGGDSRNLKPATVMSGPAAFNHEALQKYILHCAQANEGGMRDKPGKHRDFYHSCYSLSGLSVAQNFCMDESKPTAYVYGDLGNLLEPTSIVFNIGYAALDEALAHFGKFPCSHESLS